MKLKSLLSCLMFLTLATCAHADPLIYVSGLGGQIGYIDVMTHQTTLLGTNAAQPLFDIAFSPSGVLYGIGEDGTLYTINTSNGALTAVGKDGDANSLTFNSNGVLYGAFGALFTIDPSTGVNTEIGSGFGNSYHSSGDLQFINGLLYLTATTGANDDELETVNTTTGKATLVGDLGASGFYGLASPDGSTLYGLSNTSLYTIDASTGASTLDFNYGSSLGFASGASAMFVPSATPEPSSLILLGTGVLPLLAAAKRRVRS